MDPVASTPRRQSSAPVDRYGCVEMATFDSRAMRWLVADEWQGRVHALIARSPSSRSFRSFCPSCCWGCLYRFHPSPGRVKCDASHPTWSFLHLPNLLRMDCVMLTDWVCAGFHKEGGRTYATRFFPLEKEQFCMSLLLHNLGPVHGCRYFFLNSRTKWSPAKFLRRSWALIYICGIIFSIKGIPAYVITKCSEQR
jgi:hypothetical protein